MHDAVKVILIFQMGFVKPDQQEIAEVTWFFLKPRDDWNLQLALSGKLIAQQGLAGAVVVVFFSLLYAVRNKSFYTCRFQPIKCCIFVCNKTEYHKEKVDSFRTHLWSEWQDKTR